MTLHADQVTLFPYNCRHHFPIINYHLRAENSPQQFIYAIHFILYQISVRYHYPHFAKEETRTQDGKIILQ